MKILDTILAKLGGTADHVGSALNKLVSSEVSYMAPQVASAAAVIPKIATVRGVPINKEEFDSIYRPILFGEASNRPLEKKDLEARVILNTALNRVAAHKERGTDKTLKDIFTEKNQYQAYGSKQYQTYSNPQTAPDKKKRQEIDQVADSLWEQMSSGKFEDNTNNAVFYSHNEDGSITYDDTRKLFAE